MTPTSAVSLDRRGFLCSAAATAAAGSGLAAAATCLPSRRPAKAERCILLNLVGGPSQLDTFDPKPLAPSHVRGPFRPIPTRVPGLHVSELLPRLAARLDRVALVRSVFHDEAPIHETGQQLVQTGRLAEPRSEAPHVGAVVAVRSRSPHGAAGFVVVPGPIQNTGVAVSHGQSSGGFGATPTFRSADLEIVTGADLERYGASRFGRSCLAARRLAEQGVPFVAVNMFTTVFDELTWDCHADGAALRTTLADVRAAVAPQFDQAFAALLDDLEARGMLESTLVAATGEFGRTPKINRRGGRDHWPGVWTALFAGGGVRGGQAVGASDGCAAEPHDCPVPAGSIAATMLHALGVSDAERQAAGGPKAAPILELF